ncbi:unnamed protein product [Heligmosomoides polygyrus]|uniref:Uncharacterized protein n=1 Tax=Heligmosomoides polygyrus TaxID=6339 RepID=A0A3P8BZV4_HELPZ|nr:unnamed protein product [Heligmosomoides polygyrus]
MPCGARQLRRNLFPLQMESEEKGHQPPRTAGL